jgi:cell division protein FtsW (lipid II flippase)
MMKKMSIDAVAAKAASKRVRVTLLQSSLMLFQFSAFLILSLKTWPPDVQALTYAICLPAITYLLTRTIPKIWPIDSILLTLTLFLCSVSIVTLKDIARSPTTPYDQSMYMLVGIAAMIAAIWFIRRLRDWESWKNALMIGGAIALSLPLFIGEMRFGAKNWINLFNERLSIQPSEFVKIAFILVLAISFSQPNTFRERIVALLFSALLYGLLLVERDLGGLLQYFFLTIALYFLGTSNVPLTMAGLGAGAAGAYVAYNSFDYVKRRVETFINPWLDPRDSSYQIVQALIAIGSGGLFGMGLGLGMPRYIPLYHSDFIFAAICEEFGYLFSLCMLGVYVLIIMRGISIAMNASNGFHSLAAFGISVQIGVQTLIVVGGNTKLIPLTGVTLPFVAAGGSSLVSCLTLTGILLGISSINTQYERESLARAEWQEGFK